MAFEEGIVLLSQLAQALNAKLSGSGDIEISRIANLKTAGEGEISFLSDPRYRSVLAESGASAVLIRESDLEHVGDKAALVVPDPYVAFAKTAQMLDTTPPVAAGRAPSAVIDPTAEVADDAAIGPNAVIGPHAVIGQGAQIGPGVVIGQRAVIGAFTKIYSNASVYHDVTIGEHCLLQSGAVIGSDGFGYANDRGRWLKIPQTGHVKIGSFVEIGACTCIDRGALDDTVIGDNVIIDNLCQIAHNVRIGTGTAVAGSTTIAGSVKIGCYCIIGGTVIINGHIEICDGVTLTGSTIVMRSIDKPGIYSSGFPAQTNKEWRLTAARMLHINDMYRKMMQLERRIGDLEKSASEGSAEK